MRNRFAAGRQVLLQPDHRRPEVDAGQVHHQIDRPTAALAGMPVHELGARDRQRAFSGLPFAVVVPIAHRTVEEQHRFQRHRPSRSGALTEIREVHGSSLSSPASSLGRKLWQFFMLITWLVSVSRLSKAPVSWLFFSSDPHSLKPRFEVISVVLTL